MTVADASEGLAYVLELTGRALKQSQDAVVELQTRVTAAFEQIEESLGAEAAAYDLSSPDGPEAGVMLRALALVRAAMGLPPQRASTPRTQPVDPDATTVASTNGQPSAVHDPTT